MYPPAEILARQAVSQLVDDDDCYAAQPKHGEGREADFEVVEVGHGPHEVVPFDGKNQEIDTEQRN
jgi:hypothetical protein